MVHQLGSGGSFKVEREHSNEKRGELRSWVQPHLQKHVVLTVTCVVSQISRLFSQISKLSFEIADKVNVIVSTRLIGATC